MNSRARDLLWLGANEALSTPLCDLQATSKPTLAPMRINAALPPGIIERNYSDHFITLVLQSPPGAHIMVRVVVVCVVAVCVVVVREIVVRVAVVFVRTATLLWLSCKSCVARQALRSSHM